MSKVDRHLSDMVSMLFDVKTLLSGREEFHFSALTDPRRILSVNRKSGHSGVLVKSSPFVCSFNCLAIELAIETLKHSIYFKIRVKF